MLVVCRALGHCSDCSDGPTVVACMFVPSAAVGMPAVAWSNWVSMEAKSYADINRLVNLSAQNASGYDGRALGLPGVQLPEQQQVDMRRAYYSAVSHTDEQIGRILASLTTTGMRKNTVVCVFADHGWSIGEHGKWEKHSNWELDVHAPWILSLPHPAGTATALETRTQAPNKAVHLYTEHVDIMPTLLEAAAGVIIPSCDIGSHTNLCIMGRSRVSLQTAPAAGSGSSGRRFHRKTWRFLVCAAPTPFSPPW